MHVKLRLSFILLSFIISSITFTDVWCAILKIAHLDQLLMIYYELNHGYTYTMVYKVIITRYFVIIDSILHKRY